MNVSELLKAAKISQKESLLLLSFLLAKSREFLLIHPEFSLNKVVCKKYRELEKKYLAGWSIATLSGEKEFFGLTFKVDKNVLVPRPETELMVEEILKIRNASLKEINIIDIGTGSGAVIITCASEINKKNLGLFKKTLFWGLDISPLALKIAKFNSNLNKVNKNIKFLQGNLLEPLINFRDYASLLSSEIIIAANLPYLSPAQIKASPSIQKEPRLALVAGSDGLKYYRELFRQLKALYSPRSANNNSKITIFCEIDPRQNKSIILLVRKFFPEAEILIKRDLAKLNRLAIIQL